MNLQTMEWGPGGMTLETRPLTEITLPYPIKMPK